MVEQIVTQMQNEIRISMTGEVTYLDFRWLKRQMVYTFIRISMKKKHLVKKVELETSSQKRTLAATHVKLNID